MITYEPARKEQFEELMALMMDEGEYLREALRLMNITESEFHNLFRTIGQVYCIYADQQLAGFYWVEEREQILHLHAIILKAQFQGQGIGTQTLNNLTKQLKHGINGIELGVHESNLRAIRVYERNGFKMVKELHDVRFLIMQKQVR